MSDHIPYLQIKGLAKTFGDNVAVNYINLDINQHEIFALLGSSGSGKSTLLRAWKRRLTDKLFWTDKILPNSRPTTAPLI